MLGGIMENERGAVVAMTVLNCQRKGFCKV